MDSIRVILEVAAMKTNRFRLVEELNMTKRRLAVLNDVESVDHIVFEQAGPNFRDCLNPRGSEAANRQLDSGFVDF